MLDFPCWSHDPAADLCPASTLCCRLNNNISQFEPLIWQTQINFHSVCNICLPHVGVDHVRVILYTTPKLIDELMNWVNPLLTCKTVDKRGPSCGRCDTWERQPAQPQPTGPTCPSSAMPWNKIPASDEQTERGDRDFVYARLLHTLYSPAHCPSRCPTPSPTSPTSPRAGIRCLPLKSRMGSNGTHALDRAATRTLNGGDACDRDLGQTLRVRNRKREMWLWCDWGVRGVFERY